MEKNDLEIFVESLGIIRADILKIADQQPEWAMRQLRDAAADCECAVGRIKGAITALKNPNVEK